MQTLIFQVPPRETSTAERALITDDIVGQPAALQELDAHAIPRDGRQTDRPTRAVQFDRGNAVAARQGLSHQPLQKIWPGLVRIRPAQQPRDRMARDLYAAGALALVNVGRKAREAGADRVDAGRDRGQVL